MITGGKLKLSATADDPTIEDAMVDTQGSGSSINLSASESDTLATSLPAGTRLSSDLTSPGYACFSIVSRTALPTGTLALLNLSATLPVGLPMGAMQVLNVVDRYVNGVPALVNNDGLQRVVSGAQPLLAAAAPVATAMAFVAKLESSELSAKVAQAKQQWLNSDLIDTTRLSMLDNINVQIADLGGLLLGQETGDMILIDRDAAGYGWFVDLTPGQNEEFLGSQDGSLLPTAQSGAEGSMDLLTFITHEMGHLLGCTHTEDTNHTADLMDATLADGLRELPGLGGVSYYDDILSWHDVLKASRSFKS